MIIFYQHFLLHHSHNLLPLHPAWILPFALQPCRHSSFLLYTLQLVNKLLPCLILCKSNTSCISSCLCILIPITCCFGFFLSYGIFFLLNSFSYLIIPPPCLTMPRWSFCPPTYLFCCLLPYLLSLHSICFLHCQLQIPHLFYLLPTEQIPCFTLGSLSFHTFSLGMCILFFFLGAELMTTSPTRN